jgi:indole-3-glycerol phosphate synthase
MLKRVAIFKALDIEIKKQRGSVAAKGNYRGHHSLKEELSQGTITIIAEVAGGSPGLGKTRSNFKASTHAKSLIENGAKALSIATDKFLYFGDDKGLSETRSQVKVPLLRREFIFEEYQVEESKILGADAIFLMPALLSQSKLVDLHKLAVAKGLDVVFEITNDEEIKRSIEVGAQIFCIVGRNLENWNPTYDKSIALIKKIPKDSLIMFEAGINRLVQVKHLHALGVHGVIIGDALLDDFYPGKRLASLLKGEEPPVKKIPKVKVAPTPAVVPPPSKAPLAAPKATTKVGKKITKEKNSSPRKDTGSRKPGTPAHRTPSTTARKGKKEPIMAKKKAAKKATKKVAKKATKKKAAKKATKKKKR